VLHPGDVLYLPRGYLHSAKALETVSAHLTVGVHPITRFDLVDVLTSVVADDPDLRASLPLGVDVTQGATIEPDLTATVEALTRSLGSVSADAVAARLALRAARASAPAPLAPLAQAEAVARVTVDTVLMMRPHLRWAMTQGADGITLSVADRSVSLPVSSGAAIAALLEGSRLRAGELPGLGADDALVLARRLLREGLAVPAATAEPPA